MKKIIVLLTLLYTSCIAWSAGIIDVFGTSTETAEKIQKSYASKIGKVESVILEESINAKNKDFNPQRLTEASKQKQRLIDDIKQKYDLTFVDFQTIRYQDTDDFYTTIEVVTKAEKNRMRFVEKPEKTQDTKQNDIVQEMLNYMEVAIDLALNNKLDPKEYYCPVFHCVTSFNHPQLRPYLEKFNKEVANNKTNIIKIMQNDPNPERRGAAVFLLAHLKDPHQIVELLLPQINNDSYIVRNNAMRTLASTIATAKISGVNAEPFIYQLDSPYVTDRNKALYVLFELTKLEKGKQQVLSLGTGKLIRILHLKQPNNHDFAYAILKTISKQNLADNDFKGWEKWAKEISLEKKPLKT